MSIPLTPTQHTILSHAHQHTQGKITWFPDNIKGGVRQKVIDGLFKRALITYNGRDWFLSAEGYEALGMKRPDVTPPIPEVDAELELAVATAEAAWTQAPAQAKPRTRDNSKQAEVIRMLQRPEGATIGQICTATGWQVHTVRGTFAGAFKKKLGLTIVSDKPQGGERVYRIA